MRIVTWNCNGAFRKKFEHIIHFKADIYVIQECEDPASSNDTHYKTWACNYLWIGDTKNKGIGIFATQDIKITRLDWSNQYNDHTVKHFLPCNVNNQFDILAVWLHQNKSPTFGYIGQFWKYLQVNKADMANTIIVGDFNSNVRWDTWDRWWNHSDVVRELEEIGIVSAYHHINREEQGKETRPTFYLHRNVTKPYHIDYCFAPKAFIDSLSSLTVGEYHDWINFSDHVPVVLDFEVLNSINAV